MQFLSSLFGEKTLIFLGVLFALILVGAFAVTLARALGDRAGHALGGRGRQQRLGVVDAFDLDRQRQLVIIRRDNVEHLVMIGGPNDVVVESSIVRQAAAVAPHAQREPSAPAFAGGPALAARPSANGFDGRPEFEPPAPEPALPATAGGVASQAGAVAVTPSSGPRLPFPPRAAPPPPLPGAQRAVVREPARTAPPPSPPPQPQLQPQLQPPQQLPKEAAVAPPPSPAPPPAPAAPALVVQTAAREPGPGAAPPPAITPEPRPQARTALAARPARQFPTLRPGGGPLFPVRSAPVAANKPAPESPPPASAAEAAGKPNVLESFESLEEEMAKLLGRPGSGEG